MKRNFPTGIFAAVTVVLLCSTALAHHGWGGYKEKIQGLFTIAELKLGNPHDRLIAMDDAGREWNLLLAPPARNRRFGFSEASIAVGDEVEIIGQKHPSRLEIKVHCINQGDRNLYTYRYDNGRTSLERMRRGESCAPDS